MQKSSLEKWVDELQAQIDQVKREVQSTPAPTELPYTLTGGTVAITVSQDGTSDPEGSGVISGTYDTSAYDYYLTLQYYVGGVDGDLIGVADDVKVTDTADSGAFVVHSAIGGVVDGSVVLYIGLVVVSSGISISLGGPAAGFPDDGDYTMAYTLKAIKKSATQSRYNKNKK